MYLFYLIYILLTYVNGVLVIEKIIRIYKVYLNFICLNFVLLIFKTVILDFENIHILQIILLIKFNNFIGEIKLLSFLFNRVSFF